MPASAKNLLATLVWLAFGALISLQTIARDVTAHPALALIERATTAMRIDPEASRAAAESALEALTRNPNVDLEIRARLVLCDYQSERDHAAAIQQLEFAIALLPQAQRRGLRAGVLNCQGDIAEAAGEVAKAGDFLEQAVENATEEHDDEMLANALYSRGALVGVQGDFAKGLADLLRAQALFEQLNMPNHALTVHNNIAILYSRMGDYPKALEIYQSTIKAQRKAGMRRDLALTLHNIGRTQEHMEQWDAARQAFEESLAITRDLHYVRGQAYALRGVAATMTARDNARNALTTLDEAAKLQQTIADASLGARIQLERGKALRQLKRFNEAITALEQARKYYSETDAVIELGTTYDELAETHAALGVWRAAYEAREQSQAIEQKLFRNRFDQRFATLRVEFDTAATEKENAALLRENQANEKALEQGRNVRTLQAVVIGMSALLLTLLAAFAWRQRRTSLSMRELAMTDELTGVPNRRAALLRLEAIAQNGAISGCAVSIIDIDHFKSINDRHGHPQGDAILQLVARKLKSLILEPAFIGRLGGEEFLVVAPATTLASARDSAELYRATIADLDTRNALGDRTLTVSIGVCIAQPGDTPVTMLQRADAALYAAKHAGRNRVMTEIDAAA